MIRQCLGINERMGTLPLGFMPTFTRNKILTRHTTGTTKHHLIQNILFP